MNGLAFVNDVRSHGAQQANSSKDKCYIEENSGNRGKIFKCQYLEELHHLGRVLRSVGNGCMFYYVWREILHRSLTATGCGAGMAQW